MRKYFLPVVLWLLTLFLAKVFLTAGWAKFSDSSGWARAFAKWGYPVWFRLLVGVIETGGAIFLLVPRTAPFAAGALAVIMLGAMGTHLFLERNPWGMHHEALPLTLLTLVGYWRFRQLKRK